ncbi:DUF2185 domain-containing protein [Corynebacterium glucuronolyticum]|uniref:DUF2185 domain-containing protein n=1 Tax=Corynebacterium glucuronolyticum TaxID=39791 RepID=UPI00223B6D3C|nr:DUF2185 domain-containing protein [Corynebacterium glucuronolyticum]MCT1563186.1 DUF2185 domain-containing protein [Corynebacterium glucuronolyticum]
MCGGSLVSKNILSGKARVRWCVRGAPVNDLDNGWRFFSELDDDLFVNDPRNLTVCSWSTIVSSNPASPPFRLALWITFLPPAELSTVLRHIVC